MFIKIEVFALYLKFYFCSSSTQIASEHNARHPTSSSGWMGKCIERKLQQGVWYDIICLKRGENKLVDAYVYIKLSWKGS